MMKHLWSSEGSRALPKGPTVAVSRQQLINEMFFRLLHSDTSINLMGRKKINLITIIQGEEVLHEAGRKHQKGDVGEGRSGISVYWCWITR